VANVPRMGDAGIETRKWTRIEYDRLAEAEILGSADRIELLGGALIVKEPQASPHITAIRLVQRALIAAFGPGWDVREQAPVALDDDSEPEPDISVVAGDPRDYRDAHPQRPRWSWRLRSPASASTASTRAASMPAPESPTTGL
jgi:Uma2 family endonuclease